VDPAFFGLKNSWLRDPSSFKASARVTTLRTLFAHAMRGSATSTSTSTCTSTGAAAAPLALGEAITAVIFAVCWLSPSLVVDDDGCSRGLGRACACAVVAVCVNRLNFPDARAALGWAPQLEVRLCLGCINPRARGADTRTPRPTSHADMPPPSLAETYPCAPATARGRGVLLGGHAGNNVVLYANGKSIVIRSLSNPLVREGAHGIHLILMPRTMDPLHQGLTLVLLPAHH